MDSQHAEGDRTINVMFSAGGPVIVRPGVADNEIDRGDLNALRGAGVFDEHGPSLLCVSSLTRALRRDTTTIGLGSARDATNFPYLNSASRTQTLCVWHSTLRFAGRWAPRSMRKSFELSTRRSSRK